MKIAIKAIDKIKRIISNARLKSYVECGSNVRCLADAIFINKNVKLGNNVILYPNVSFEGDGNIKIGDNVKIGTNTVISASKEGGVSIGNDTIIAANCYIIDSNHGTKKNMKISSQPLESKKLIIGKDVWIGTNSSIIMNSKIEDGAVIGANSLVNSIIETNAIAVGSPAKIIKYRK